MISRVEKLEKDAAYRERLFSIKLSEYSATFDRLEVQLESVAEWVNDKLIALHEQANERNAVVEAQVGGMVATMAETQVELEAKIADINKTSRFLGRTPPRLNPMTDVIDVDEMEESTKTGAMSAAAPAAPPLPSDQMTVAAAMGPLPGPAVAAFSPPPVTGSTPSPPSHPLTPELDPASATDNGAAMIGPAVTAPAPPTLSRHPVATAPPSLTRQEGPPLPAPTAPEPAPAVLPLPAITEAAEETPAPSPTSSALTSPAPTPKRPSPPRSHSTMDELEEDDEDQPRRSVRQRSAGPVALAPAPADAAPRPLVKRGRAGSKKPKAG